LAVLDGEVAVPCTHNPLQWGRIPSRGFLPVGTGRDKWQRRLGPTQWELPNPARSGRKQR